MDFGVIIDAAFGYESTVEFLRDDAEWPVSTSVAGDGDI